MAGEQVGSGKASQAFLYLAVLWLLLAALAFWAHYSGSAPFDTLGIPISQLVLGCVFGAIWMVRRRT
jgi:hypothetical protein